MRPGDDSSQPILFRNSKRRCLPEECGRREMRHMFLPEGGNAAARWFLAAEATGDFMGIRYGRQAAGTDEVEWMFVPHAECDGIGGFARLLRERGADLDKLPTTNHPDRGFVRPFLNLLWKKGSAGKVAVRADWSPPEGSEGVPEAVAWKLFSEQETELLRERCRREKLTVNSFLLKQLDLAVRPDIRAPDAVIPWMIPVNLRGDGTHADDTENHVSSVDIHISPDDTAAEIQCGVLKCLERGEHRANYLILCLGKFLSHRTKVRLVRKSRSLPGGNIGAFSNLGVWDAGKAMPADSWLFCPPVCKGQLLGAGCVTFQNRLSLTIQSHAGRSKVEAWMERWVAPLTPS